MTDFNTWKKSFDLHLPYTGSDPFTKSDLSTLTLRVQSLQMDLLSFQGQILSAFVQISACRFQEPGDPQLLAYLNTASACKDAAQADVDRYNGIITQWNKALSYSTATSYVSGDTQAPLAQLVYTAYQIYDDVTAQLKTILALVPQSQSIVTADELAKAMAADKIAAATTANTAAIVASADATDHLANAVEKLNTDQAVPDPAVQNEVNAARGSVDIARDYAATAQEQTTLYRVDLSLAHFTPKDIRDNAGASMPTSTAKKINLPLLAAVAVGAFLFMGKK